MNSTIQFQPAINQLTGPAGALTIAPNDFLARRFLMLMEGQCSGLDITAVAEKYGYCRQRYYQLLDTFNQAGLTALQPGKTGPKTNYRRTEQAVRQILRQLFLDPDASAKVVRQKLDQTGLAISLRSVQRVVADYGLQKKTLRTQPRPKTASRSSAGAKHPRAPADGRRQSPGPRARGPSTTGR